MSALDKPALAGVGGCSKKQSRLDKFTRRLSYPYLHGTYFGVNAIQDAYLLVDGPNCGFHKAEHVFGAHDWFSSLLDVSGFHRVMHTDVHPNTIIGGSDERFSAVMKMMAASEVPDVIFLGSMPMASMTGTDYDGLMAQVQVETNVPIVNLPDRSLDRDWLDGYADFLLQIAKDLDPGFPEPERDDRKVAVVGHLMHRNEEDMRGNLRELKRMCAGAGLELVSVWLEGGRYEDLGRAYEAGHIVSLPYGRKAAKRLARKSGANLVEVDLPLGPEASERFVRALGEAAGTERKAERFIAQELQRVARAWEWLIPKRLQFRSVAYHGDPYLMPGLAELTRLLAMELVELTAYAQPKKELEPDGELGRHLPVPITWQPRVGVDHDLGRSERGIDLVIGCSDTRQLVPPDAAFLEFGYPMRDVHFTSDAPFLGFAGALHLVDRISNTLGDRASYI
ncbi:MAG: hypothetical protein EP329_07355 [Deltaproteobacteria bacterium]|nr:MAG: hypothetical protein EP329_07355 [Deltaproteobacteria bacterium]